MDELKQFDKTYLTNDGPSALVIRQHLMPVEGEDGVLFPATYAEIGYNIDIDDNGKNVVLVDSVGSQANRIEPIFLENEYKLLIPQIVIKTGAKEVSILEAGHRAGDALLRCTSLQKDLQNAFKSSQNGDAEPLAKIAPTSLVFGVWDSRDTQEKRPRLIASTIRAFNVRKLTRSAVYTPPVDYSELDVFTEEDKQKAEGDSKNPLSKRGFVNALANSSHGGVIAEGGILRNSTLGLAALRLLKVGKDANKTLALQRYILGLTLVAFTKNPSGYLRQGCLLVLNPDKVGENECVEVWPTGKRTPCLITHEAALKYAIAAAKEFGVGADKTVDFEPKQAREDVKRGVKSKKKKGDKKSVETVVVPEDSNDE